MRVEKFAAVQFGGAGGEVRSVAGSDPRARIAELRAAGFEVTCRGEMEQDRTWKGADCFCGRCGERIPRLFDRHDCKGARRGGR